MGLQKSVMFRYVPIPPGKFQIRLGKNASGHASQVERSRISSSVENLNIPRGSCNVTNKEDFKIDFYRRSRELFYLRPDCKTCNARAVRVHSTRWLLTCSWHQKNRNHQFTNLKCYKMSIKGFKMKNKGLKCFSK